MKRIRNQIYEHLQHAVFFERPIGGRRANVPNDLDSMTRFINGTDPQCIFDELGYANIVDEPRRSGKRLLQGNNVANVSDVFVDALQVFQIAASLFRQMPGQRIDELRQLTRTGPQTELSLDDTIDETCKNAGELEVVMRAARRNNVRVVLLLDVGGSMTPDRKSVV